MADTLVHPSQRRVACELCRRHKSKCQRIHPNDRKCSRCMIWPTPGTETIHQRQLTLSIPNDDHEFPVANIDSTINFTTSDDHTNRIYRASPTLEIAGQERLRGDIASTEAGVNLSKINLDLHIRLAAAEMNHTILDLNSFIYREGPLFIQDYTLAEFLLKTSEDFSQILRRLCTSQTLSPSHNLTSTCSFAVSYFATKQLPPPLALTITSIFTQLISLYEVLLDHLITRIERLSTEPLTPIPSIKFKGLLRSDKPYAQVMLFSNIIVELLEEIEGSLGINEMPGQREICLLSSRQVDVLWSELEGRVGVTSGDGAMKPADVKQLFKKVAIILHKFTLRE